MTPREQQRPAGGPGAASLQTNEGRTMETVLVEPDVVKRGPPSPARGRHRPPMVEIPEVSEDWPEPALLPAGLPPVPELTADMLPVPLRAWITDAAERMQCPLEYIGVGAVVALSAVVGRRCAIRPKRLDSWEVIPNLWGAVVGPASVLKSPALREALSPLDRLDAEAHADHEKETAAFRRSEVAATAKRDAIKAKISSAAQAGDDVEVSQLEAQLAELERAAPNPRRFIVHDPTVEQLGNLMQQNPRGLLLVRDELSGWLRSLDKEGHKTDRAFYLETWSGDGRFTVDRVIRGHLRINAMCLSVLGGIQPGPLSVYMRAALQPGADSDGLIQRFQLLVYPELARDWRNIDRAPDIAAREKAVEIFRRLDRLDAVVLGAQAEDERNPPFLRYSEEAQEIADQHRADLEHRVRRPSDHPALISHLGKYRSLVPSMALLFHLADCVVGQAKGPVSADAVKRALDWAEYLLQHARRVYGAGREGESSPARLLAEKIKAQALPPEFSARDVYQRGWAGLDSSTVEKAAGVLVDYDWLRVQPLKTRGRPRTVYRVNPRVCR